MVFGERGRVDCVVRGRTRVSGLLEPLTCVEVLLKPSRSLPSVQDIALVQRYPAILGDYDRTLWAGVWLQLWLRVFEADQDSPQAYALLRTALDALEAGLQPEWLATWVEMRVLRLHGSEPIWDECRRCADSAVVGYSQAAGGALCRSCLSRGGVTLRPSVLAWLKYFSRASLARLAGARPTPEDVADIRRVMEGWMQMVFPK